MNKKYAVLLSVLMMGLALSGVTYAHWIKVIELGGEIHSGELWLDMTAGTYDLYTDDFYKDVAYWCGVDDCTADNEWHFGLCNVYPCLDARFWVRLTNTGTIPAGLASLVLDMQWDPTHPAGDPNYIPYEYGVDWDYDCDDVDADGYYTITIYNLAYGTLNDLPPAHPRYGGLGTGRMMTIKYKPIVGAPWIDPGQELDPYENRGPDMQHGWCQIDPDGWVEVDVKLHFYEALPQDCHFKFGLTAQYWNWNEAPDCPCFICPVVA